METHVQGATGSGMACVTAAPGAERPHTTLSEPVESSWSALRDDGFILFNMGDLASDARYGSGFIQLLSAFEQLPPDPYAGSAGRFRRYDHAVILPWDRRIEWVPPTSGSDGKSRAEYYQGAHNPEHPGERRAFPALGDELRTNPVLNALIWNDFDLTSWGAHERSLPLHVGVHMVKLLAAEPGTTAISSPNMLHQDGEPFTFAHLVSRNNAIGGENVIAAPRCAGFMPEEFASGTLIARFELQGVLDSYGVYDPKVSHYVGGISQRDPAQPAERCVLLIDFAVMAVAT